MSNKRGRPKSPTPDPVIGQRICEARSIAGLSQTALGIKIGVTKDTIRNWEHGRALPATEDKYEKIAKVCNVSKEWLMNKEVKDIIKKSYDILKTFNMDDWECHTFPTIKEEARSYALIYSLNMCGYKLEDIKDKKQYSEYMESSIRTSIEFYMKNLNNIQRKERKSNE